MRIFATVLMGALLCMTVSVSTAYASDYSTNLVEQSGTFTDEFTSFDRVHRGKTYGVKLNATEESVSLKQDEEGDYRSVGKVVSKNVEPHYTYTESASITVVAEIPEGTSIDLYVMRVDQEQEGDALYDTSHSFQKVDLGTTYTIGTFVYATHSMEFNTLRWKAVLRTSDPHKTPTLDSVIINYNNASPRARHIDLLQHTFNVDQSDGASVKITLYGKGFREGQEEVYLKDLFAASNVTFIDANTLVATIPIQALSAGSYTVVFRNTDTGRIAVTDGEPAPSSALYLRDQYGMILK